MQTSAKTKGHNEFFSGIFFFFFASPKLFLAKEIKQVPAKYWIRFGMLDLQKF